jgi:hypothetical protein
VTTMRKRITGVAMVLAAFFAAGGVAFADQPQHPEHPGHPARPVMSPPATSPPDTPLGQDNVNRLGTKRQSDT